MRHLRFEPSFRAVRLADTGRIALVDVDTGEAVVTGPRDDEVNPTGNYSLTAEIPFEPFTVAEMNRPNPLMDTAVAELSGTDIDTSADVAQLAADVALPDGYDWYYTGNLIAMGKSPKGNDFEFDIATRKVSRATSANGKKKIVEYANRWYDKRASVKFEVPAATIRKWRERKPWEVLARAMAAEVRRVKGYRQTSQTLAA